MHVGVSLYSYKWEHYMPGYNINALYRVMSTSSVWALPYTVYKWETTCQDTNHVSSLTGTRRYSNSVPNSTGVSALQLLTVPGNASLYCLKRTMAPKGHC